MLIDSKYYENKGATTEKNLFASIYELAKNAIAYSTDA